MKEYSYVINAKCKTGRLVYGKGGTNLRQLTLDFLDYMKKYKEHFEYLKKCKPGWAITKVEITKITYTCEFVKKDVFKFDIHTCKLRYKKTITDPRGK